MELAQQYYTGLRTVFYVELVKVPSHVGVPGNQLADSLAKRGVTSYGQTGRFSSRSPLNPPQLGYNPDIWLSKIPQGQSDFLCSKSLRKRIKKSASRDKERHCIAQHLQEDFHGSSIAQWRTARSIRKPFTPRSVNLFDIHGKLSSKDLRATTFAEYLSEAPDPQPLIPNSPSPSVDCSAPFTMAELNIVLRSLSTGRAPGPDSIPADMRKGCPDILKVFLLDHCNHCLSTSTVPDSWA